MGPYLLIWPVPYWAGALIMGLVLIPATVCLLLMAAAGREVYPGAAFSLGVFAVIGWAMVTVFLWQLAAWVLAVIAMGMAAVQMVFIIRRAIIRHIARRAL